MRKYAITPGLLPSGFTFDEAQGLVLRCAELAAGGVDLLMIRERALVAVEATLLTRRVVDAVHGSGMKVILAGMAEAAQAGGANGVHLRADDVALRPDGIVSRFVEARKTFPRGWISVSCHTLQEVAEAAALAADALVFAPVFGKTVDGVEVVPGVGLARLAEACTAAGGVPVFALGGVTAENAGQCVAAGADGVAGIRMFFG